MSLLSRARLPIAKPCPENFDGMEKSGARAFCERCDKSVHDLSEMTRAEAGGFLARNHGKRVCVRYRAGRDGTIRFRQPPPLAKASGLLALAGLMSACAGHSDMSLQIPDGESCADMSGYVIPCEDALAYAPPPPDPDPVSDPDPGSDPQPSVTPPDPPDFDPEVDLPENLDPTVGEPTFPDPATYAGIDESEMLMGEPATDFTDRELRQMGHAADREEKRMTARQRRIRRRQARR